MRLDADRPHAGPAAAMRDAEGLVQVEVADVSADVPGPREADQCIHVGAVEVDLAAVACVIAQISVTVSSNTPCVEG